jgi:hypothetical protein
LKVEGSFFVACVVWLLLLLDASLVVAILVEGGDDGRVEDVMVLAINFGVKLEEA